MISYLSYNVGSFFARHLPPPLSQSITRTIGLNFCRLRPGLRENVAQNLRIVLGDEATDREIDRLSRNVFVNFSRSIYCFLRLPHMRDSELARCCDVSEATEMAADFRGNGGFVLAGPHVGAWEIGGACLSARGIGIHTVAFEHPSRAVTRFFEDRRKGMGIACHPIGKSFNVLAQALERGKCVALLVDRGSGRGEKKYSLFGHRIGLPSGHAALAVRCSVPIVTAVCVFAGDDKLKLELRGPYYPDSSLGDTAAVDDLIEKCRLDTEGFIRKYPEQWFNFRPI